MGMHVYIYICLHLSFCEQPRKDQEAQMMGERLLESLGANIRNLMQE